jgi:hypothetical protein
MRNCGYRALFVAGCLSGLAACSTTSVDQVWHDPGRAKTALGSTLVIAVAPRPDTSLALENEWVKALQAKGVAATGLNAVLPGKPLPDRARVVELVKSKGFNSVLVTRVVDKKTLEQQVALGGPAIGTSGYSGDSFSDFYGTSRAYASTSTYTIERQVVVVETSLYDASTEKRFWSARSDTFLEGSANELIQGFVGSMMKEMAKSNVL